MELPGFFKKIGYSSRIEAANLPANSAWQLGQGSEAKGSAPLDPHQCLALSSVQRADPLTFFSFTRLPWLNNPARLGKSLEYDNNSDCAAIYAAIRQCFLRCHMKKAFIDLGANIGEVSERFAAQNPGFDIFCVEPNQSLLPCLFEISARVGRPFCVIWAAAWIKDGILDFYQSSANQASTIVEGKVEHSGWPQIDYERPTIVPSIDFSGWVRRLLSGYDEIVVKMDIEGAEYAVLEKMIEDRTLGLVTRMMCEWHVDRYPNISLDRHNTIKQKVESLVHLEPWY